MTGVGAGAVRRRGQRLARRRTNGQGRRLVAARSDVHAAPQYFHPPAVGRGRRVRRPSEVGAPRTSARPTRSCSTTSRDRVGRLPRGERAPADDAGAGRRGDRLGLGPRPAHLGRQRATCRRRASPPPAASTVDAVRSLIDDHTDGRVARVPRRARRNVLELNLALDALGADLGESPDRMAPRHAAHLPRRRAWRGQDLRHAQRGPPPAPSGAPTSSSASSRPTAGPTTAEQIGDLEVVPRRQRRVPRHDVRGDGRRRRAGPAARRSRSSTSSRTPTSRAVRNEKRWQDVEELLDAGIDVISTVNIQHLEIAQRRRRAHHRHHAARDDARRRSCARADQIELVDMTPEALRRRMAHGNIYPAEQDRRRARATTSGRATWRRSRELALLWVADRVDEALAGVPRAPRHHRAVGDARARRRRAHRRAGRRPPDPAGGADRPTRAKASCSASTSAPSDGLAGAGRRSCSTSTARCSSELGGEYHEVGGRRHRRRARRLRPARERDPARARREPPVALGGADHAGSVINGVIRAVGHDRRPRDLAPRETDHERAIALPPPADGLRCRPGVAGSRGHWPSRARRS